MKKSEIIKRLKIESNNVPDVLDKIKADPKFFVPEPINKVRMPRVRYAFLSIIIIIALAFSISPRVAATEAIVTMDINPSIQFEISKKEKVLKLTAINEDGEELLRDIKYKRKTIAEVLDLVIEAAISKEYITEDDYILIGIESEDEEFSDLVLKRVNEKVKKKLEEKQKKAEVVVDKIKKNKVDKKSDESNESKDNNINNSTNTKVTDSKRKLIEETIRITDYTVEDFDDLASWKVKDLYNVLRDVYIKIIIKNTDYEQSDYKKLSKLRIEKLLEILEDNQ
ncbi:hypothetical protein RJG79_03610 [Mycoplasmatota bacterium WC44]